MIICVSFVYYKKTAKQKTIFWNPEWIAICNRKTTPSYNWLRWVLNSLGNPSSLWTLPLYLTLLSLWGFLSSQRIQISMAFDTWLLRHFLKQLKLWINLFELIFSYHRFETKEDIGTPFTPTKNWNFTQNIYCAGYFFMYYVSEPVHTYATTCTGYSIIDIILIITHKMLY